MSQSEQMQGNQARPYEEDDEQYSDAEEPADAVEREGQREENDADYEFYRDESNGNATGQQQQQQPPQQQQQDQSEDEEQQNNNANAGGGELQQQQQQQEDRSSATNLIINYLPQDMTDRELYNLFSSCGSINTCKIMRDFKTGYSFGYGFVDYNAEADSEDAIQKFNGFYVRNKRLKVSYARPGGQSIKDTNLYVVNLSRNINEEMLDRIFSPFGQIVQRNILRDRLTGRPRGVAFVRYSKREEAQEAMKTLNNTVPEGGSQPIWLRLAEEHGKAKAAQFMSQISGMGGGPQQPPPHHHQQQQHHNPHMQQQQQQHYHHHQKQQHYQQQQQQHHHQQQQHQINHHQQQLPPHHMQQLHHNMGVNVGVGMSIGVGVPLPMHGGGVGGGYHHMAHRGRSNRQARSQKPHPYNNAQKFI